MVKLVGKGQTGTNSPSQCPSKFESLEGRTEFWSQHKSCRYFFLVFYPYKERPNPSSRAPDIA